MLVALATVPFAFAGPGTNQWWLGAVLLVRGLGLGVVLIPVMTVAFADLAPGEMPHASMLTRISQQVGGSFGVAVGAVVLQSALASGHTSTQAFGQAFGGRSGSPWSLRWPRFSCPAAAPRRSHKRTWRTRPAVPQA